MSDKLSEKFSANPYNINNRLISSNEVVNLMKKLKIDNFTINNVSLYQTSFIHKSYCSMKDYEKYDYPGEPYLPLQEQSYEIMEFLGDAILGSVVSSYIYKRFHIIHNQNEGFLTKLKVRIVCGQNLAKLSNDLSLNEYLVISKHIEDNCDGRNNENILEDVLESLIGAIYLDHSYEVVERFIIQLMETYVDFTEILLTDTNYKDRISRYIQKNFQVYPQYKHMKLEDCFCCEIYKGDVLISTGKGISKKKSEQEASRQALIFYNVIT